MSRQFDDYMSDKFEIYGELYSFVEPTNFEELMKAYEVLAIIENHYYSLMNDDDSQEAWLEILEEQKGYIQNYLDNLEDFDNNCLISNINYLLKKWGMKIGDLESAIGLSVGYISRTAKADSKKKMSIDVVWKIAQLFEVDIKALLEKDLSVPKRGVVMLIKFIAKLKKQTLLNEINWSAHGGCMCQLLPKYESMGLITEGEEDTPTYHSDILNSEICWCLMDDIYAYENFDEGKDLVIVSVANPNCDNHRIFDFLLIWEENGTNKWERVFCTSDDAFAHLSDRAADLVDLIAQQEFEPKLSTKHRNMIAAFLKEDN